MMKNIVDIKISDIKEIYSTNRYLQTYINSYKRESEKNASYPEQSTVHFEDVVNIIVYSDSVTSQKKKNGIEEYGQKDRRIPYYKNETNKITNASKTVDASKTIEKITIIIF